MSRKGYKKAEPVNVEYNITGDLVEKTEMEPVVKFITPSDGEDHPAGDGPNLIPATAPSLPHPNEKSSKSGPVMGFLPPHNG